MSGENKLPECPNYVAHPQSVWFNEHWRPVIDKLKEEYFNQINLLKQKLLAFEGMTFSENQQIKDYEDALLKYSHEQSHGFTAREVLNKYKKDEG